MIVKIKYSKYSAFNSRKIDINEKLNEKITCIGFDEFGWCGAKLCSKRILKRVL